MSELNHKRLLAELTAIHERYPTMRLLTREPPTLEGTIEIDGDARRVRLSLPPSYPGVPPTVREIDAHTGQEVSSQGRASRLSNHGICLFPHGSDPGAWHRERMAVEALGQFEQFIRQEGSGAELHRAMDAIHLPPSMIDQLLELGPGHIVARRAAVGGDLFADVVRFENSAELDYHALAPQWKNLLPAEVEIPWVILKTDRQWAELAGSREQLDSTLKEQLPEASYRRLHSVPSLLLVRKGPPGSAHAVEVACVHRPAKDVRMLLELDVIRAAPDERLFQRIDGALGSREDLARETVVLVGLGSLGSTVALALARAGVRKFVLIDRDVLTIENVCRHTGTLRDLGRPKVDVVGGAIASVNPDAEVRIINNWLAWDLPWLSAGPELERICAKRQPCTIISTCAQDTVDRQLNALAVDRGTPAVYAWALGAAEHGRIFRVLPGQTPCWQCVATAQDNDPTKFPRFIPPGHESEEPPPYLDPTLPGLGLDITQIATIVARYTLQTIALVRGFDLGLPDEPGHHLLWTNRGGWLFDRPQQLMVEHFPHDPSCAVCGSNRPSDALDAAGEEQLADLIRKLRREVP